MTTSAPTAAPAVILDPERLLGFQPLADEAGSVDDWSASLADLHNKIGDGGEVPGPPALTP